MKQKHLYFFYFFCNVCFSQTIFKNTIQILADKEYYRSWNLTGYKVYDSTFKEWKYYKVGYSSLWKKTNSI
jgi:plasmid rolling circle replication initiator protein Rep